MNLEKVLRTSIKIAGVVLTAPATLRVAAKPYADAPMLGAVIALAALVLVEGGMLLGWTLLDSKRRAAPQQRALYATIAAVGYLALWGIAFGNGEGLTGIAFRLTLGVMVGFSIVESGVLANVRLSRRIDKQIPSDVNTRRGRRDYKKRLSASEVNMNAKRILFLERESTERLQGVHKGTMRDLRKKHRQPSATEGNGNLSYPIDAAREHRKQNARTAKDVAIKRMADALKINPDVGATELADVAGVARSTVYKYLADARAMAGLGYNEYAGVRINGDS